MRMAPSSPQLASERPSGLTLSDWTVPWCAWRVCTHFPRSTSHQRSMPSLSPLISIVPVGLHTSAYTTSLSSLKAFRGSPLCASQTKSSPLPRPPPPLARRVLSGLHATHITMPRCPCRRARCVPVAAPHKVPRPHQPPLATPIPPRPPTTPPTP